MDLLYTRDPVLNIVQMEQLKIMQNVYLVSRTVSNAILLTLKNVLGVIKVYSFIMVNVFQNALLVTSPTMEIATHAYQDVMFVLVLKYVKDVSILFY